jgi:hypothetical protein
LTRSNRPAREPADGPKKYSEQAKLSAKLAQFKDWLTAKPIQFKNWLAQRRSMAVLEPEHIEPGRRLMAIGIDFGAAYLVSIMVMMIPFVNRVLDINLIMLILICARDYIFGGRGLGKNIMGFKVVDIFTGQAPGIKQVLIRNLVWLGPLLFLQALQRLLHIIPVPLLTYFIGQIANILATLYVLVILPLECYRSYQREDSMRLGDEIAGTCLLESETDFSGFLPK